MWAKIKKKLIKQNSCKLMHMKYALILEIYKKARMKRPTFNGTICDTMFPPEDFINHMSVQYGMVS